MRIKTTCTTAAVCFLLGLLAASGIRAARACSCATGSLWNLQLASIDGDGDPAAEERSWAPEVSLVEEDGSFGLTFAGGTIELRRIP